jgi:hypothetical protein
LVGVGMPGAGAAGGGLRPGKAATAASGSGVAWASVPRHPQATARRVD